MRRIVLIAHNLRSIHNVGSLLRTADGLGIEIVYLTGYTPYPKSADDDRLPHVANKIHAQINKTALGAEDSVKWQQSTNILEVIERLRSDGFEILALEQTEHSVPLPELKVHEKIALIVGREVEGIEHEVIEQADRVVKIPMLGMKESFNVVQAAAMAVYHLRFIG